MDTALIRFREPHLTPEFGPHARCFVAGHLSVAAFASRLAAVQERSGLLVHRPVYIVIRLYKYTKWSVSRSWLRDVRSVAS